MWGPTKALEGPRQTLTVLVHLPWGSFSLLIPQCEVSRHLVVLGPGQVAMGVAIKPCC